MSRCNLFFFFELTVEIIPEIVANVNLTVDTTNTDDIDGAIDSFEKSVDDSWRTESDHVFITSAPSEVPTISPSSPPTTLLPTTQPSITGLVVTIDVTRFFFLFDDMYHFILRLLQP